MTDTAPDLSAVAPAFVEMAHRIVSPTLIPAWTSPEVDEFAVLKLEPWRLRVFPGTLLLKGEGELLSWRR